MAEGRAARLGRYIAKSITQYSTPEFQEAVKNPSYMEIIRRILSEGFEPRRKGALNPRKNKSPLADISYEEFNISDPAHCAALLIERGHFNYNVSTANRIRKSLLENL